MFVVLDVWEAAELCIGQASLNGLLVPALPFVWLMPKFSQQILVVSSDFYKFARLSSKGDVENFDSSIQVLSASIDHSETRVVDILLKKGMNRSSDFELIFVVLGSPDPSLLERFHPLYSACYDFPYIQHVHSLLIFLVIGLIQKNLHHIVLWNIHEQLLAE